MALYLKSLEDIEALIIGPTYAAIPEARKREIAVHYEEMPANVREAALGVMLTTYSVPEQNFALALFTDTPPAGGPTQPPATPTVSSDERRGLVSVAQGADQVTITFTPAFSAIPLPPECIVLKGSPSDDNVFVTGIETLTANSCVARLSAAAPNGNYKVSFRGVLS